jgi:hypothetical protein
MSITGCNLVRDAFQKNFDVAAVLTNDTDLLEPMRVVNRELDLPIILLTPTPQPATSLVRVLSAVRHITPYIGPCQLPDPILLPGKPPVKKRESW